MKILALDLATKTGWAHSCGASGVWDLKIFPDESQGMRLIRFESKLREVVTSVGINVVVFEAVNAGSGAAANFDAMKMLVELVAIVKRLAEAERCYGFETMSVNMQTIKSHALPGVAKRDKAAMIDAAKRKWPAVEIVDDNQADALWLLDYTQHRLAANAAFEAELEKSGIPGT